MICSGATSRGGATEELENPYSGQDIETCRPPGGGGGGAAPDHRIEKTPDRDDNVSLLAGETVDFTIVWRQNRPAPLTGVAFADGLPAVGGWSLMDVGANALGFVLQDSLMPVVGFAPPHPIAWSLSRRDIAVKPGPTSSARPAIASRSRPHA